MTGVEKTRTAAALPTLTSAPTLHDHVLDDMTGQSETPCATALRADRAQGDWTAEPSYPILGWRRRNNRNILHQ